MLARPSVTRSGVAWSGVLLALGGLGLALFVLVHPYDQLAGAEAMRHPRWIPAHTLHFVGALLVTFGLPGLYARRLAGYGWLGAATFALAFAGTAMFAGTGMITAYLWPMMAEHAPHLVDAEGAVFTSRLSTLTTAAPYALMVPDYVLLAVAGVRGRWLAWPPAVVLALSAVLFAAPVDPVGPAPWIARVAGGVMLGGALAWTGYRLWAGAGEAPDAGEPSPARASARG